MMNSKFKTYGLFFCFIIASITVTFLSQWTLLTRNIYYNSFQSQLDNARIDALFDEITKYSWLSNMLVTILILINNAFSD